MFDVQAYQQASFRARSKLDFYVHLIAFVTVNLALVVINLVTMPQYLWFTWGLLGWGTGLFCHWVAVFPGSKLAFKMFLREYEELRDPPSFK